MRVWFIKNGKYKVIHNVTISGDTVNNLIDAMAAKGYQYSGIK